MVTITDPGVYFDLPAETYHAQHDWLSWSRMKQLIPPKTPAHFAATLGAPEARKRHFDLGKVVHRLVLGDGDQFEVVQALNRQKVAYDAVDYTTVSAQADRERIYDAGHVPILRGELTSAEAMAKAVNANPTALALLSAGRPEVSLFWIDPETGVKCRARLDWLPEVRKGRRLIVPDLKTADSANPREFSKQAGKLRYFGQHVHYSDGVKVLGLDPDPAFVFVVVEKDDPQLVIVGQYGDKDDLALARAVVDRCRRLFRDCTNSGVWPGYPPGVTDLRIPTFVHYDLEEFCS